MIKVLIIDRFPADFLNRLEHPDAAVNYFPDKTRAEILAVLPGVDVLVMNSRIRIDAAALAVADRLQLICRAGVGLDHIDLALCAEKGVKVVNAPGANADPVAEQAIGMLLGLMHNVFRAGRQVEAFRWERELNRGVELMGKTVGIIGYGNTGSAVGRRLAGFGCRVLAYDKYKSGFGGAGVEEVPLEALFQDCEVLTLHIPLTAETEGWISRAFLRQFSRPLWLLNLSRGPILPLAELIEALDEGLVLGAGLDVLENEKLDRLSEAERSRLNNLFARENVIITPHIGGWSHESLQRINNRMADAVRSLYA